ncbi:MAG: sigma-54 dependent transcriptional regulator, partial [Deltaproteobacteria bacterium]|nr:sigma-54 dependent transcriptional regulator [Deltaproteobacteria bacterium]
FTFVVERALSMSQEARSKPAPAAAAATAAATEAALAAPAGGPAPDGRDLVTADPAMQQLLGVAENVARSKATVLIQSESGTGKELLARYIHVRSDRPDGPFVAVNCAALPETLLESELFGHRKGAFTGAIQDHKGRFEQAHGGTILLDEISEMALPLQAKLLRVLQEHEVDRIGGKEPISVDVRVIATTNRDLFKYVEEGKFREDLYYRLNVIPMRLPPLRERKGDVPLLADHFIRKHAMRNGRSAVAISNEAIEVLCHYNWRGNVRELENVMERALLLCDGKSILPHHLLMGQSPSTAQAAAAIAPAPAAQEAPAAGSNGSGSPAQPSGETLGISVGMSMREVEKKLIFETLRNTGGNRTQAAKVLSISIRTLRNKLNEYAADGEEFEMETQD